MEAIYEKWEQILQFVKEEHDISQVSFDTWLKPLETAAQQNCKKTNFRFRCRRTFQFKSELYF